LCIHIDILCAHAKFQGKPTFFVYYVKHIKVISHEELFLATNFVSILRMTQKKSPFFVKPLCEHIECQDICVTFFIDFFYISNVFKL
jgi:hypothetical protein